MKPLIVIVVGACFALLSVAGEKPASGPPPSAQETATNEPAWRDPFAAEGGQPQKVSDPLEPMNRAFYHFNDKLYAWALEPAAKGYNKVTPQPFRIAIRQFFTNLKFPIRFVNNLLQAKFQRAGIETTRFVVNSTVGVGGFFDPAHDGLKLEAQPADFDQTLGVYGLPTGMYLHWPVLGPSSVRGTVGKAGDLAATPPWTYIDDFILDLGVYSWMGIHSYEAVNETSFRLDEYETFRKATFDPYVAARSAYFENRRSVVRNAYATGRRSKGEVNEALAAEERAIAYRVRDQLVVSRRLDFAELGLFRGRKGAEMLLKKGSLAAPKGNTNFNLIIDLKHEGAAKPSPATNAPATLKP